MRAIQNVLTLCASTPVEWYKDCREKPIRRHSSTAGIFSPLPSTLWVMAVRIEALIAATTCQPRSSCWISMRRGYIAALGAGVQTVMVSYSSWLGVKMHGQHYLLTDVL